jgi:hypothetical protein
MKLRGPQRPKGTGTYIHFIKKRIPLSLQGWSFERTTCAESASS